MKSSVYIEREGEVGVEARKQYEERCDEVVDGAGPDVWRQKQGDDVNNGCEGTADVLKKIKYIPNLYFGRNKFNILL